MHHMTVDRIAKQARVAASDSQQDTVLKILAISI